MRTWGREEIMKFIVSAIALMAMSATHPSSARVDQAAGQEDRVPSASGQPADRDQETRSTPGDVALGNVALGRRTAPSPPVAPLSWRAGVIHFDAARALPRSYTGKRKLVRVLESRSAQKRLRPLSLASGDFDRDGVPDLAVGYGAGAEGIVVLYRGNEDSIYPNSPQARARKERGIATDSPFLMPGRVLATPERPDFLLAGDFNGDGPIDLLMAAEGGYAVQVLPGDGAGGFGAPMKMPVGGAITTVAAGETDRPDGVPDLVLGMASAEGSRLVVYQSRAGAVKADPVTIDIPAPATSLLMGQIDEDVWMDLAATAGKTLVIVHGRDGLLGTGRGAAPARVERIGFSSVITGAALGRFDADPEHDMATDMALHFEDGSIRTGSFEEILANSRKSENPARTMKLMSTATATRLGPDARIQAAKVSSGRGDDLLVIEPGNPRIRLAAVPVPRQGDGTGADREIDLGGASPKAVLPMRLNGDGLMDLVVLNGADAESSGGTPIVLAMTSPANTFTVTSTADSGTGSLRTAIAQANGQPGADLIVFNITPAGPKTIQPVAFLGAIEEAVTIDGTTQPGYAGTPIIQLDGIAAGSVDGFQLVGGPAVIHGLVINRWNSMGIWTSPDNGHFIEGNYIGTDLSGTLARPNAGGVSLFFGNTLGGTSTLARNVISGNLGHGVSIYGNSNVIKSNYIGTVADGSTALGNFNGIKFWDGTGNSVGGAEGANVISGNLHTGIEMGPGGFGGNRVEGGNLIGLKADCISALPNALRGIEINDSPNNSIFGNFISGNGYEGITIANPGATNNAIVGASIGENCADAAVGNGTNGVRIVNGPSNNAVGLGATGGNRIAHNGDTGIFIDSGTGNLISGNYVFDNGGLGIDLGPGVFSNGVTPNDPGDGDMGANQLQNYPVLIRASSCGSNLVPYTRIRGIFASLPSATFRVQLFSNASCDPSGYGEGETLLAAEPTVATDGSGNGGFDVNLPAFIPAGSSVTATATDASSLNTSEFSACLAVADLTPTGEAAPLVWATGSKTNLEWLPVPGATSYRVHRGEPSTLNRLLTANTDACWRMTTTGLSTGPVLTETPAPGSFFWYLVRPVMDYCEGPAGLASSGPRIQNSGGVCADAQACSHATCATGGPLVSGCDPCATAICAADPFCCGTFWDGQCVNEVRTYCGSLACSASQGTCAHTHCSVGSALVSGCDDPPVTPGCVSRICLSDPYCCAAVWDGICVEEVASICGQTCY